MTFYYRTTTATSGDQQVSAETKAFWIHASAKKNWRIVQLPNGYYQTELLLEGSWKDVTRRETLNDAEEAIDKSIEHYKTRIEFAHGPKVIKTFE
tara:strand:- start:1906 stop:2190 length:285 start_codon:yes stop_codon:yes gene_type:complete